MTTVPPYSLGFPSSSAQSAYYPYDMLGRDEIAMVSEAMERHGVLLENTRLYKTVQDDKAIFVVLQASVEAGLEQEFSLDHGKGVVRVMRGDHSAELTRVCESLREAIKFTSNEIQRQTLLNYIASFTSGSLEAYRDSQKSWVKDTSPAVENIFGFVEPYRDPYGVRAEWESFVAISDKEETTRLKRVVECSDTSIRRLPWATGQSDNAGKGPFEKTLFEPPDIMSVHGTFGSGAELGRTCAVESTC